MADFSALKTAIQANIRTNGNEEITGAILRDILLSVVTTMGDGAINDLAEALQAEITNRQNAVGGEATSRAEADSQLSGRINAEAQARGEADTQLDNSITAITTRLNEGYVYAGIATPSTNPGTPTGKVFYIALQSGTYTNFSSLTVTQGINILKYNGTAWSQEQIVGIDDVPTKESNKLVKSGGVFANMGAFDISDYHKSGSTLATYADLTAALAALPSDFQKGGMSVKFVQSSDNKYIQARCMADSFTTDITKWQNVGDFVEEKEHPIADNEVAGYLTDKNKTIIAKFMKSGAVEWLVKNTDITNIESSISNIQSEIENLDSIFVKETNENISTDYVGLIVSKTGAIIGTISNNGSVSFLAGGGFAGEENTIKEIIDNKIKVIVSKNNYIIGWIDADGKAHIEDLEVNKLQVNDKTFSAVPEQMFTIMGIMAKGNLKRKFVNNTTYNLLYANKGYYKKDGKPLNTVPTISLHDDDAIDYQLQGDTPSSTMGGFGTTLWVLIKAFTEKYKDAINGNLVVDVNAEGQRVGLTPMDSDEDTFDGTLNLIGNHLKAICEHSGWGVHCHSMTAMYNSNNYLVEDLNSTFANQILQNGNWHGHLKYNTATVYNLDDGKNYEIKSDRSGWNELPIRFAKPYCALTMDSDSKLVINPTYSVKYQVDEWFKRAKQAGLYTDDYRVTCGWGSSPSVWLIKELLKYSDDYFAGHANSNIIPLHTSIRRLNYGPDVSNVYDKASYERMINAIDEVFANNGWCILESHANAGGFYNGYNDGVTYGADAAYCGESCYVDNNYNPEWILPLKKNEVETMDANNYWEIPPSRLGINSWADWYPCPGTALAMLWDALVYAVNKGIKFSRSIDYLKKYGNVLNVGVFAEYSDMQNWADSQLDRNTVEENQSYCVVGADGSINYYSY